MGYNDVIYEDRCAVNGLKGACDVVKVNHGIVCGALL